MLNKEFYSEDILKTALSLLGFTKGEWKPCQDIDCKNCKFDRLKQNCISLKEEFLKQETQVNQLGFTLQDKNENFISTEDSNISDILNTKRILIVSLKGYKTYLSYLHKIIEDGYLFSPFDEINEEGIFYYNEEENKFDKVIETKKTLQEFLDKANEGDTLVIKKTKDGYIIKASEKK